MVKLHIITIGHKNWAFTYLLAAICTSAAMTIYSVLVRKMLSCYLVEQSSFKISNLDEKRQFHASPPHPPYL